VTELRLDRGCVTHLSADGRERRRVLHTGRPNGLAVDNEATIWVAESMSPPSVIATSLDGTVRTRIERVAGRAMLWPNDICVGPDGLLYVTDSGTDVREFLPGGSIRPDYAEIDYDGRVYRIDPATGDGKILDEGLRFTNGIAFGVDGRLYVNETMTGNVYVYAFEGGRLGERELFGNVLDPDASVAGLRGPDGMAFSADGRLWVAVFGQADVTVLAPDGTVAARLPTQGAAPTNVAFGPRGSRALYCVEDELGQIEVLDVGVDGLALHH
jgi:gluconolactonase